MSEKLQKKISLILPVYNEEAILTKAVIEVYTTLETDFEDFELILIDDGCKDNSFEIMLKLKQDFPKIILLQNFVNLNQGVSVQRGFVIAKNEFVVHNGIDLPLKPKDLKELVKGMENIDLLVLERNVYSGATNWRRLVSKLNIALRSFLFPILSRNITDMNFVQIYRKDIMKSILPLAKSPAFTTPEMIFRARHNGYNVVTKSIDFEARTVGKGSLGKLHDILWSTYDMFRFRYLLWIGLAKHGKTK